MKESLVVHTNVICSLKRDVTCIGARDLALPRILSLYVQPFWGIRKSSLLPVEEKRRNIWGLEHPWGIRLFW
jgi:hypothetical protein